MEYTMFVERARQRARDERHQARWSDGRLTVKSESEPGERYTQVFEILDTGALWLHCDCPSGLFRGHQLVSCKHCTRWGDRMMRELAGTIRFEEGIYWMAEAEITPRTAGMSAAIAAQTCAERIMDDLRSKVERGEELDETEHKEWDRISEILSRP